MMWKLTGTGSVVKVVDCERADSQLFYLSPDKFLEGLFGEGGDLVDETGEYRIRGDDEAAFSAFYASNLPWEVLARFSPLAIIIRRVTSREITPEQAAKRLRKILLICNN